MSDFYYGLVGPGSSGGSLLKLDGNHSGEVSVVWVRDYTDSYKIVVNRYNPSTGWGTPEVIYTLNKVGYVNILDLHIKVNELGNVTVLWTKVQDQLIQFMTKTYNTNTDWQAEPSVIADNILSTEDIATGALKVVVEHPKLLLGSLENAKVLWSKSLYSSDEYYPPESSLVDRQLLSQTSLSTSEWDVTTNNLAGEFNALNGEYQIATNSKGSAILSWKEYDSNSNIIIKTSFYTPGAGWQQPVTHGTEMSSLKGIALGDNNDAVLVSTRVNTVDNVNGAITVKRYSSTTGWQSIEYIMPTDSQDSRNISVDVNENGIVSIVGSRQLEVGDVGPSSYYAANKIFNLTYRPQTGWDVYREISGTQSIVNIVPEYLGVGWDSLGHTYEPFVRVKPNDSVFVVSHITDGVFEAPMTAVATNSFIRIPGTLPVANAGVDQTANQNTTVTLDGTASSDLNGSIVAYEWMQVSGATVSIANANTATTTITLPRVLQDTDLHFMLKVRDEHYNSSVDFVKVTVLATAVDTTPPVVNAPAAITIAANAQLTTVSLGTASANDDIDGVLTATADNTGPFAVGTHTITWSATDAAGNVGSATQTLTITDTTAPVVTAPASISVEANATLTTIALGIAAANDSVDGALTATASNTDPFAVGTHTVTWSATDSAGNVGTATQTVTVTDTTAPAVTVSPSITIEATGPLTAVTLGAATATDLVDGAITPTPSLNSPFTVGTHIVIWTATDAAGNMGSAAQLITITDTTAPTVTAPANISLEATGPLTTVILGTATATDLVDGSLTPKADKTSPFTVGVHTVTWSATDSMVIPALRLNL